MGGPIRAFQLVGSPWCIERDFNVTRFPNERVGVTLLALTMREFLAHACVS